MDIGICMCTVISLFLSQEQLVCSTVQNCNSLVITNTEQHQVMRFALCPRGKEIWQCWEFSKPVRGILARDST